jgi:hypothetical protein
MRSGDRMAEIVESGKGEKLAIISVTNSSV